MDAGEQEDFMNASQVKKVRYSIHTGYDDTPISEQTEDSLLNDNLLRTINQWPNIFKH